MPVKKIYTYAEAKSAIDIANRHFFNTLIRVRSDVSVSDWGKNKVKVARDSAGKPVDPLAWRGRGSDVGHNFRHVNDTAEAGKSVYQDELTAVHVTCELLNSATGQEKLAALDAAQPDADEPDAANNRKIIAAVSGLWYGRRSRDAPLLKIDTACCEVMKLGSDTLWVHTTYPKRFKN